MGIELKQSVSLSQQLIMTPQLQQAIKLLQLSRMELIETINQEMEENPVLDESANLEYDIDKPADENRETQDIPDVSEVTSEEKIPEDIDWEEVYTQEYNSGRAESIYEKKEAISFENIVSSKTDLTSHLMWQLGMCDLDEQGQTIGTHIIGNLNNDGYLDVPIEDIVEETGCPEDKVLQTLKTIQTFDPVGIAARTVEECLLIQARLHNLEGTIVEDIIKNHLHDIQNKQYKTIAQKLSAPIKEVINAITIIQGMEPKPGRPYSNEEPVYITPDIYIVKVGDDYEILLNQNGMPKLKINPYYSEMLSKKDNLTDEARAYIQEKLKSASWLIKSIYQRQETIYKVTESILRFQRDFFDHGITHLKPLILRDIAQDIDMHESTVSRITTNKYVHTPRGLFELKFFFNSSVKGISGTSFASKSVKEYIRNIIKREDRKKPYSDKEIVAMLSKLNIKIARRTVAKYRESMGILPSKHRKKPY